LFVRMAGGCRGVVVVDEEGSFVAGEALLSR
jgi:hypothetical protein